MNKAVQLQLEQLDEYEKKFRKFVVKGYKLLGDLKTFEHYEGSLSVKYAREEFDRMVEWATGTLDKKRMQLLSQTEDKGEP